MPTQLNAARIEVLLSAVNGTALMGARLEVLVRNAFLLTAARLEVLQEPFTAPITTGCAGEPDSYFIFPDQFLKGASNVLSVTSEAGPYPGAAGANDNNLGKMVPVQRGRLTDSAEGLVYRINKAGGGGAAEWIWRRQSETASDFYGANDPRMFHQWHSPIAVADGGSDNCATVYASAFRRLVAMAVDSASVVTIAYRDVDLDAYDDWTTATFTLQNPILGGHHNCQMVELSDKRLGLVVRTIAVDDGSGAADDFDVYHSVDGGLNWVIIAEQIARTAGLVAATTTGILGEVPNGRTAAQIRLAVSGEHIRLAWVDDDTAGNIRHLYSTDRMVSWRELAVDFGSTSVPGDADDVTPFDIVGVGSTGLFILMKMSSVVGRVNQYIARADGAFTGTDDYDTPSTLAVRQILLIDTPDWVYHFLWYDDLAAGVSDAWAIRRSRPEYVDDFDAWEQNPKMNTQQGTLTVPCRVSAVWYGQGIFFHGARKNEATGVDVDDPLAWYWGGWSQRSYGRYGPGTKLNSTFQPLASHLWHPGCGAPDAAGAAVWVRTTVATGAVAVTMDSMEITGVAAADELRFGNAVGFNIGNKSVTKFFVKLDTGDSTASADDVAVRLKGTDGQGGSVGVDVSLRISPTGILVYDNTAAATLATVVVPGGMDTGAGGGGIPGEFFEVRYALRFDDVTLLVSAILSVRNTLTGVITVSAVHLPDNTAVVTSSADFGHFGQVQATQMRSWWREFSVADGTIGREFDSSGGAFANPDDLLGQQASTGGTHYIEHGMEVSWAGIGAALGDLFSGDVRHQHPAEAVLIDSPRIDWRSSSQANQTMILDADPDDGFCRFDHDSIAVFGTNDRMITVEYATDAVFTSPVVAGTIDCTAFGTGATALTVDSVNGCTIRISGSPDWVVGEAVDHYMRMTNGSANGLTFKITRHSAAVVIHMGEETASLASQGVASSNSFVIFASHGALVYPVPIIGPVLRYMRLAFGDSDTAEADHRLGRLVVGRRLRLTVPMDWAYTDDEQPNVTEYRTRGAVTWAFPEGPAQRSIVGRVVGDADRWRDRLRFLLRQAGYEARSIALVLDGERLAETVMLGRVKSGSSNDNAAWYRDSAGVLRQAGDVSITFAEDV